MPFLTLPNSRVRDPSLWTLIFANIFTIVIAQLERWDFATVLWVYLGQSVAIGLVGMGRILFGETQTEYGGGTLDRVARFFENGMSSGVFLLYYGGFHLVYFLVLRDFFGFPPAEERGWILVGASVFFLHHAFSFVYHRWLSSDAQTRSIHPYVRILPLHLTLVLFSLARNAVLLFLVIRAVIDLSLHVFEHQSVKSRLEPRIKK